MGSVGTRHTRRFLFFRQKTAYELRISDWSSDVCSSDLDVSNARKRRSLLAATKARPVWVTSTPPSDGTPIVRGSIVRNHMGPVSRLVPNGRDQRILRAVRSIALIRPHGGCWQGT